MQQHIGFIKRQIIKDCSAFLNQDENDTSLQV